MRELSNGVNLTMARYSLIMKDLVFTSIVQYGAKQEPVKTFGKLANEILSEWASEHAGYKGPVSRECFSCEGYVQDICEFPASPFFNKHPPFKKGCGFHEKRE